MVLSSCPGARDGWDWDCELAENWCRDDDAVEVVIGRAVAIGRLTAEMHAALATAPVTERDDSVERFRSQGLALLDEALAAAGEPEGTWIRRLEPAIRSELADFGGFTDDTPVALQAVHGDLHVGQMILSGDDLFVIVFDGDPVAAPAHRHRAQPAARDLAAIIQAIDHVGRVVDKRLGFARRDRVDAFIVASTRAALDAYRERLDDLGRPVIVQESLLRPFRIVQELHELVYAARHLPHWRYVPDADLPALFREPTTGTP